MQRVTPVGAAALVAMRAAAGAQELAGARLSYRSQAEASQLVITFVEGPAPNDAVLRLDGLVAYVAPAVAEGLAQAILDGRVEDGKPRLLLRL